MTLGTSPAATRSHSAQWPEKLIARADFYFGVVQQPGSDVAYGLVSASSTAAWGHLVRVNLSTGKTTNGPFVFTDAELATVGNAVAVLEPRSVSVASDGQLAPSTVEGLEELYLISPGAAQFGRGVLLRALGHAQMFRVAPNNPTSAGGVWLAIGQTPVLFSATTGKILRRLQPLPAPITSMVVAPNARLLYAEIVSNGRPVVLNTVDEIDATSGRVLVSHSLGYAAGADVEASSNSGVWVGIGYGMGGTMEHLSASELRPTPLGGPRGESLGGSNDESVTLLGGTAWLYSTAGIVCTDPSGRVEHAGEWFAGVVSGSRVNLGGATNPFVPLAVSHKVLYGVRQVGRGTAPFGIVRVTVPSSCW